MLRIYSIFRRDFKSSIREFLLLYIILAPILITLGLRFFIPSVNSISLQFALDSSLDSQVVEEFNKYGKVEILNGSTDIRNRVNKVDDIIGITKNTEGKYQIIMEGNEKEGYSYIPYQIINNIGKNISETSTTYISLDREMPMITIYGAAFMIIMAIVLSGMVIGLNIVEEKEAGTVEALNVTPMGKLEFILGKSILGFVIPIAETFIILWILGLTGLNIGMVLVLTIASSLIAIIFGFLIGVLSGNQIAGIANFKFLLLFVSASCIGAIALPEAMHKYIYWSPLYWSSYGLIKVVMNSASWTNVWIYTAWILGLTALVFLVFRSKIQKGLSAEKAN